MLFTKVHFRPLLNPFIARFILIIEESPSKKGADKGSKWGPNPLNTPRCDKPGDTRLAQRGRCVLGSE